MKTGSLIAHSIKQVSREQRLNHKGHEGPQRIAAQSTDILFGSHSSILSYLAPMATALEKSVSEAAPSIEPNFRQFTGQIVDPLRREGLLLAEVDHKVAKSIPAHTHDFAYFALVLQGEMEESVRGKYVQYSPFTVAFNPLGTKHDGHVGARGVRLFTVQIGEHWLKSFREYARFEETIPEFHAGKLVWLAARLFREYREGIAASSLTIESTTWEMLAVAAHCAEPRQKQAPPWLRHVFDRLHSQFHQPLTITQLATEAGVQLVGVAGGGASSLAICTP